MYASFTRQEIVKRGYSKKNPEQDKYTHTFLDASGVAYVPDGKREWLCGVMAYDWQLHGEATKCAISEVVDPNKFTFCMDWDFKNGDGQPLETQESLKAYSRTAIKTVAKFDPPDEKDIDTRRWAALYTPQFKMHPYYVGNICNLQRMCTIGLMMVDDLIKEHGERLPPKNSWADVLDLCIYTSSLRAPLTAKFLTCERCKCELKKIDVKKTNKTTPTALKRISTVCPNPDCFHGRICSGAKSIYQLGFILRPDGTEDTELCDYLKQDDVAMLKLCTPWHWGKPLSGWQRPIGAALGKLPAKKKTLKNLKLVDENGSAGGGGKGEKQKTPSAYAASLKRELNDEEKANLNDTKCKIMVHAHESPFKTLQKLLQDGNLGTNYTRLQVKSLWKNKKETCMFAKVGGPSQHLCEFVKREHGSYTIYLQISNTMFGAAVYFRCWHHNCRKKKSAPYTLTGQEFYDMFPSAKLENAHKVLAPVHAPSSKKRQAPAPSLEMPSSSSSSSSSSSRPVGRPLVPASKKMKLSGANLLSTLLAESGAS